MAYTDEQMVSGDRPLSQAMNQLSKNIDLVSELARQVETRLQDFVFRPPDAANEEKKPSGVSPHLASHVGYVSQLAFQTEMIADRLRDLLDHLQI